MDKFKQNKTREKAQLKTKLIDRLKQNKNAKKDSSHLVPPVNGVGQLTAGLGLESGRGWDSGSALRMINMDDDDKYDDHNNADGDGGGGGGGSKEYFV